MFCSNCGKELNKTAQFCSNCGCKVANNNNTNNQFAKVVITRLEGSKFFNKTPMKIIYNGGIIKKIVAGEVLELEFPVGQNSVIFDANGDIQDYVINVEHPNSMIYIDISVISELSHSSGIPKIQSVRTEDAIVPVNSNYSLSYNEILTNINNDKNSNSSYMGMYGIVCIICLIIGLFIMGYAMSLSAIAFGFMGLRRSKILKNEKGNFLCLIGIIGGIIEFAIMLTQSFTFK